MVSTVGRPAHIQFARNGTRGGRYMSSRLFTGRLTIEDVLVPITSTAAKTRKKRPPVQQAGVATLHLNGEGLLSKCGKKAYTMGETYVTASSASIDDNIAETITAASNMPLLTATTAPDRPGILTGDMSEFNWISIGI
ncbi:hypothetical protein M752DRAFT_284566 [Aspergillus phoenicis ATCC 13157]|uniref:Uncharacterized protein n=1 Tax=Aspergillus phoenicis ATCC 13157 TaxID=1353007 RepID=A0A370PFW1_ASPPH|nr:hypothetical protein M752DRAFT_284566 [Aspergillus phoenicis ATCC 13157]